MEKELLNTEKRRSPRFFISRPVMTSIDGVPDAKLSNLSQGGVGIGVESSKVRKILLGQEVRVKVNGTIDTIGEIARAHMVAPGLFSLGIHFKKEIDKVLLGGFLQEFGGYKNQPTGGYKISGSQIVFEGKIDGDFSREIMTLVGTGLYSSINITRMQTLSSQVYALLAFLSEKKSVRIVYAGNNKEVIELLKIFKVNFQTK